MRDWCTSIARITTPDGYLSFGSMVLCALRVVAASPCAYMFECTRVVPPCLLSPLFVNKVHRLDPRGEQQMWFAGLSQRLRYEGVDIEVLITNSFKTIFEPNDGPLLVDITVASDWDKKEHLFRKYAMTRGSEIKATLHGPQGGTDPCADYSGIVHRDGKTCCADTCGEYCGAYDCDKGKGGSFHCCASKIKEQNRACKTGAFTGAPAVVKAPCLLPKQVSVLPAN